MDVVSAIEKVKQGLNFLFFIFFKKKKRDPTIKFGALLKDELKNNLEVVNPDLWS